MAMSGNRPDPEVAKAIIAEALESGQASIDDGTCAHLIDDFDGLNDEQKREAYRYMVALAVGALAKYGGMKLAGQVQISVRVDQQ